MTGTISLSHPNLRTVDLTNMNCSVQYVTNNPLWIMPIGGGLQIATNFNLLSVRINLSFDLVDGIADFSKFKDLRDFATTVGGIVPITFTWGSDTFRVQVESFTATTQPGKFNFMQGCSMTLVPCL